MQRRIFLRNTALLTAGSLFMRQQALAAFFNRSPHTIRMIRENVGVFTEKGGTIGFVLSENGITVIDSQFPDSVAHFMGEVKKLKDKPFDYLLNTHHHPDHTSGNIAFSGLVEHIVAHENAASNQRAQAERNGTLDKQLYPTVTFSDESKVKISDDKIKGYHFGPAHTNGDAAYYIKDANVVHLGDLMFNKCHAVMYSVDKGSIINWIKVLEQVVKKFEKDTIYIFGHAHDPSAVTGTSKEILEFRDYLNRVVDFTKSELKAGKPKEEFAKSASIPGTDLKCGSPERILRAAWEELNA